MKAYNKEKIDYQFKILYAIGMIMVINNHISGGGTDLFSI